MRMILFATLGLASFAVLASLVRANADDAASPPVTSPPAASAPPSPEELSLRGFGAQNAQCLEWTDSCAVCLRDEKDAAHCSTPGIACQPQPIVCRREKAK